MDKFTCRDLVETALKRAIRVSSNLPLDNFFSEDELVKFSNCKVPKTPTYANPIYCSTDGPLGDIFDIVYMICVMDLKDFEMANKASNWMHYFRDHPSIY